MPPGAVLDRCRAAYARGAWREAHEALAAADRSGRLGEDDLLRLAVCAYMLGREDEYLQVRERVHQHQLAAGDAAGAARTACFIGMHLLTLGEAARGGGWIGRAQRLVQQLDAVCVEHGYVLLPLAHRQAMTGDLDAAIATAGSAVAIAERFGDRDLLALALFSHGHALIIGGQAAEGLPLLDEAMVAVTTGELTPIVTGIVYCGAILGCQEAFEPLRAQEWTQALSRWCRDHPDMVAFSGRCHVHRAEIMQLKGAWADAFSEARTGARRATLGRHRAAIAEAAYVQGEVLRLRGEPAAAEAAYREASAQGREPQPGLALLRLGEGNLDAAVAGIRRAVAEAGDASARARLLPACAEIMLAAGDVDAAREAGEELATFAAGNDSNVLRAIVEQIRGAVELAAGEPARALPALRRAWAAWEAVQAPYEAARVRVLLGHACRALGDADAAELELDAARSTFERLGARPDLARLDARPGDGAAGLTGRELQVLRLVAGGRTNKAIAAELVLSERTVDRHVSNIFVKLGVSSRTAATAFAYEHHMV